MDFIKVKSQAFITGRKAIMLQTEEEVPSLSILHSSKGGLHKPNPSFQQDCKKFEHLFCIFHSDGLDQDSNIIERLDGRLIASFKDK